MTICILVLISMAENQKHPISFPGSLRCQISATYSKRCMGDTVTSIYEQM
jgi:hypothetical protein